MWEAKAAPGRGPELLAWVLAHAPAEADVYRGADGRVVAIVPGDLALPEAPAGLLARPVHAWPFEPVPR